MIGQLAILGPQMNESLYGPKFWTTWLGALTGRNRCLLGSFLPPDGWPGDPSSQSTLPGLHGHQSQEGQWKQPSPRKLTSDCMTPPGQTFLYGTDDRPSWPS